MAASLMAQAELLRLSTRETENLSRTAQTTARHFEGISTATRNVASSISIATRDLLRWTGLVGAGVGLLGFGSVFGLEHLASSAGSMRRSAQGLGASPAEVQAFRLNLERVVDTNSFLSGVNQARTDLSLRSSFYGAGMGESQIAGRNTVQLAQELLPRLKRIVDRTPDAMLEQVLSSTHIDQFLVNRENALRLKNTPADRLNEYQLRSQADVEKLKIDDRDLERWQDFNIQLERAGHTIWNSLIQGLAPLAPELDKLSLAFGEAIKNLLASPAFRDFVLGATEALKQFAGYVGKPEFQEDVKSFAANVQELAKSVVAALRWLGAIPDPNSADQRSLTQRVPGHEGFVPAPTPSLEKQPFSWWNPGSWTSSGHQPGSAPWEHGATLTAPQREAIARAEGTFGSSGINYNMVHGGGTVAGLTGMNLNEAMAMSRQLGDGVGGFQELHNSIAEAARALKLDPATTKFTPEVQGQIADYIYGKQGTGAWHGFQQHPEQLKAFEQQSGGGGAYGIPGAIMNYGATGALGKAGTNLVKVTTSSGKSYTVNAAAADAFSGFVGDLEKTGYKIDSIGGFSLRNKAGGSTLSEHAYGAAIDINPSRNAMGGAGTDMPRNIHDLAAAHGLIWGGDWRGKSYDPMHFQYAGPNAHPPGLPTVTVNVNNQTGGSANVSAAQVGTP